jgi:peptidoglycan/xylan/chitin deacetylase (PgdA/CDA1 family)
MRATANATRHAAFNRGAIPGRVLCYLLLCAAIFWPAGPLHAEGEQPRPLPPALPAEAGDKVLYLTFDDGPSNYTAQILDVLARYDAKATFFVLGRQAAGQQELLAAMFAAGHGIANHTYSHPSLPALGKQRFTDEVLGTANVLGGLDHGCLRPPYGAANNSVRTYAADLGYSIVTWTIDPRDWSRPGAGAIAQRVIGRAFPGGVVVMHDGGGDRSQTVAALETILATLRAQGYTFGALCRAGAPAPFTPPQQMQPGMGPQELPPAPPGAPSEPGVPSAAAGPSGGLSQPSSGAVLGGTVVVQGFAAHPTFRKWQLDLLIDGASETFLALGETAVPQGGELFTWDTTSYPNGDHILRLRVVYAGLNYDEFAVPLTLRN